MKHYGKALIILHTSMGIDSRTGHRWWLTSWISDVVPASGSFTIGGDPNDTSQLVLWWQGNVYRTSGLWINGYFVNSDISELSTSGYVSFNYISNENEKYLIYSVNKTESWIKFIMDLNGNVIGGGGELTGFLNFFRHNNVCEEKKTLPECRKDDNYYFERRQGYVYGGYKPDGNYNVSIFDCRDKCEQNFSCFFLITQDGTGCQIWSEVSYIPLYNEPGILY